MRRVIAAAPRTGVRVSFGRSCGGRSVGFGRVGQRILGRPGAIAEPNRFAAPATPGTRHEAGRRRLAGHLAEEEAAARSGDRFLSIRLSAEFHSILADLTGNAFVIRQMQELVARTMMLVAFFEPDSSVACQCREHRTVVRALANGERSRVLKAMTTHLSLVETRLRPRICEDLPAPLDEVLRDELARLGTRASAADGALQGG